MNKERAFKFNAINRNTINILDSLALIYHNVDHACSSFENDKNHAEAVTNYFFEMGESDWHNDSVDVLLKAVNNRDDYIHLLEFAIEKLETIFIDANDLKKDLEEKLKEAKNFDCVNTLGEIVYAEKEIEEAKKIEEPEKSNG